MRKLRAAIPLAMILTLALGLRVWGIGWGMPYAFHPDEENYLPGAVGMLIKGDLNPHYFHNPPLLTYTVLLELLLYLKVGQLLGFLQLAADLGHQLLVSPTPLYVLARMNSALLGTATVFATYLVAKRLLGGKSALASALLLAVAFLHVRDSHYAVNDVPAAFLLMVSVYFATRIYAPSPAVNPSPEDTPARWRDYLLGGIFLGLAVATKYNVGLGAVALLAAHLLRRRLHGSLNLATHLPLVAAGAVSLLAFVLANPYSLLDYPVFLKGFAGQYGWTADPFNTSDLSTGRVILRALSTGTSPVLLGASALGLVLMALRQPREALLLASFPLGYLAFFLFGSSLFYARFALPLIPFVALLAGYAAVNLIPKAPSATWQGRIQVLVVLLLSLQPLALDLKHNSLLRVEDTRLLLGRWIEENVPPGSSLAVEGYSFVDSRGRRTGPKKLEYPLALPSSLRAYTLDHLTRGDFDYLVASSYVYGRYQLDPTAHRESIEFYRQIDQSFPLVAAFFPTADGRELPFNMDDEITPIWTVLERERPGPTLKVYRVGEPPQYRVRWLEAAVPEQLSVGEKRVIPVTLQNLGNLSWPSEGYTPVRVGYRWLDARGQEAKVLDLHSPLPAEVKPGGEAAAQVDLVAPAIPGDYTLQLDLVQENFAWFSAKGAETKNVRVTVR